MSPWDRYRLQWYDHPDGSGGTSSCKDQRIHDELMIEPGDIRPGLVSAVLTHDIERTVYACMRVNPCRWEPLMDRTEIIRLNREQRIWDATRYRK